MLQGVGIDINPAGRIGQRAFFNEIRRALRRRDMNHVERFGNALLVAFAVGGFESGDFGRAVNSNQIVVETGFNAVVGDDFA